MKWILALMTVCLISCSEEVKLPIPEEKMAHILKDMLFAEAVMNRVGRSVEDSLQKVYYQQIYQIHDIDSTQLANSFKIMQENPELSEKLYLKAEDLLEAAEAEAK